MADFIQNGGSNGGSYASYFSAILSVWEGAYDESTNTRTLGYKLVLRSGSAGRFGDYSALFNVAFDGNIVNSGSGRYTSQSYNTSQTICEGTTTVKYNDDGNKTVACSATLDFQSGTYSPGDFYPAGNLPLTTVQRYAEINNCYVESTGLNTAVIRYAVSKAANIYCSIDNGAWGNPRVSNTVNGAFTVDGLSPNVQHSFRILAKAVDSGLDRASNYFYGTTKDYAKITSASDCNYGDDVNLTFANLTNGDVALNVMIDDVEICKRTGLTANYTLTFSKDELSKIIKLLKNESTKITYIAVTNNVYQSSKNALVVLIKNLYRKENGHWRKSRLYPKKDNVFHKVKLFYKVSGEWRDTV